MDSNVSDPSDELPLSIDLSVESERLRLGPSGLRGCFAIAAQWNLTEYQMRRLLALEANDELGRDEADPDPRLFTEDRMLRIGCLIGIYRGLHTCFGDEVADAWITRWKFEGQPVLDYMIRGGLDAIFAVRRLIKAWCAGNY